METDGGRGFAEMYRNSTEEMFLKSIMESSIGMPVPTMEMLGFKNLSQNFRTDSEELFKSWLTNGETHGYNSPSIAYRTRQASKRISTELVNLSTQQQGGIQKKRSNDVLFPIPDDIPSDLNQQSLRNASERSVQASNLYLAKAWFHSPQPMTRSRSSELRRRYVAMQSTHTPSGLEVMQNASGNAVNNLKQEIANPTGFDEPQMHDTAHQLPPFMSPSNSSSSTFHAPEMGNIDNISSVVSMLKGTLERKKLGSHMEKEAVDDSSNAFYHAQDIMFNVGFDPRKGENGIHEIPVPLQEISNGQVQDPVNLQTVQESMEFGLEGFVNNPGSTIHFGAVSREASQSESSAAAPVLSSSCFDACDGPSNSSQNPSISESSKKQVGNNSFRGKITDNLKDERKRGGVARYGSVTSAGSVQKGDPTKKRRVERSRKMAEAKERNLTPAIPTDMQAVLKRCDNLEKEVRSLKLNLSFMNRKDSEQTKQIEELQKQNEELVDEKERLLEEIERIISESAKM